MEPFVPSPIGSLNNPNLSPATCSLCKKEKPFALLHVDQGTKERTVLCVPCLHEARTGNLLTSEMTPAIRAMLHEV